MATFDFTSPDGKSYSVQGPDGATPDQAFQILQQHLGAAPASDSAPSVGIGEDAAKSTASGLASAAASTFGAAGDLRSGLSAATDYLGNKAGIAPDKVQAFKDYAAKAAGMTGVGYALANAPTSRDIINHSDPIVSPDYKPQTTLGGYLKTGAEFAPGLLAGGEGGLGANFLKNVAAPAIASETAGNLTAATPAEPYARLGGALVGGVGASALARKFQEMGAAAQAAKAVPTADDLLKSGSNGFEAVKASDAVIKPSSVEQMAKDIKTEMLNEGKHPTSEGQAGVFDALDRLERMGQLPGGVTPKDMEVIRKNLVDLKTNLAAGPTARMATDKFMEKYSNLGAGDLLNGSNPFPTLKTAVGDWAAGRRSQTIQGKRDLAELNAGTAGSGANIDNNTRQAIKQLARPINNTNVPVARRLGFNNQEVDAIKRAATGTLAGNAARYVGKAAPTGIVSGFMAGGAGHAVGGPIGAVALPAVGYLAKKIGDLSTKRAVTALDSLVRSRSPLAQQVAAQLAPQITSQLPAKTQRILRALAVTAPAVRQQMGQQVTQPVGQANPY